MEIEQTLAACFEFILQYRPFMHRAMIRQWRMWDADAREEIISDFLLTAPRILQYYNGTVSLKTYILDRFKYFLRVKYRMKKRSPPVVFDSQILRHSLAVDGDDISPAMTEKMRQVLMTANDPMLLIDRFLRNMTYREMGIKRNLTAERMRQKVAWEIEHIKKKIVEL